MGQNEIPQKSDASYWKWTESAVPWNFNFDPFLNQKSELESSQPHSASARLSKNRGADSSRHFQLPGTSRKPFHLALKRATEMARRDKKSCSHLKQLSSADVGKKETSWCLVAGWYCGHHQWPRWWTMPGQFFGSLLSYRAYVFDHVFSAKCQELPVVSIDR